jgi:hypothetical protein
VIHFLAVALLVLSGALAIFGIVTTLRNRPAERPHVLGTGLLEAVLVIQALIGAARVLGGHRLAETSTFMIYLAVSVCLLPMGLQFARAEPTRWGGLVVAVAAVAIGVVEIRLLDLWGASVG